MKVSSIQIIQTLKDQGFNALWAGGCVRDILLGIKPKDFDIVTDARPEQVENIFDKTIPIGKHFGIIMLDFQGHHFEIATFRKESDYQDGRRPSSVEFTDDYQDAKRRDFTINGMFFDPLKDQIIDHVNGQKDLALKLVRFIGDPSQRIQEDNLRILRAVRFKNTLDFQYCPQTYSAIKKHATLIQNVSKERIQTELNKILQDKNRAKALDDLEDLGLLDYLLPELKACMGVAQPQDFHQEGDVYTHILQSLASMPEGLNLSMYWAVLLHDIGKPQTYSDHENRIKFNGHAELSSQIAIQILKKYKFSNQFIKHVAFLVEKHMSIYQIFEMPLKTQIKWFRHLWYLDLLELNKYDILGTTPSDLSTYLQVLKLYHNTVKDLPAEYPKLISGNQIMQILNIPAGPKVAQIIQEIQDLQLENQITTPLQAVKYVEDLKNQ